MEEESLDRREFIGDSLAAGVAVGGAMEVACAIDVPGTIAGLQKFLQAGRTAAMPIAGREIGFLAGLQGGWHEQMYADATRGMVHTITDPTIPLNIRQHFLVELRGMAAYCHKPFAAIIRQTCDKLGARGLLTGTHPVFEDTPEFQSLRYKNALPETVVPNPDTFPVIAEIMKNVIAHKEFIAEEQWEALTNETQP